MTADAVSSIITEIQKTDDYFTKAHLIELLKKQHGVTIKDISSKLRMKPSYVCHIMRLNRIPEMVIDGYYSKLVSLSHLFVLSRVKDQKTMMDMYETVLKNNLSVLQTEELVRLELYGIKTEGDYIPKEELRHLIEKAIGSTRNASIRVIQTRVKTKLIVDMKGKVSSTAPLLRTILSQLRLGS